jgi:hypothetical protein
MQNEIPVMDSQMIGPAGQQEKQQMLPSQFVPIESLVWL